jgi:hypothetical protein
MCNPDDLNSFEVTENEEINEEDARLAEEESDVVMNQRRDEIAQLM